LRVGLRALFCAFCFGPSKSQILGPQTAFEGYRFEGTVRDALSTLPQRLSLTQTLSFCRLNASAFTILCHDLFGKEAIDDQLCMDDHGGCMGGLRTLSMGIQNLKSAKKRRKVLTKPVFEPMTFQRMLIRSSQRHSRMIMSIFGLASIQCRPKFMAVSYNLKILTIYLGIHLHTHTTHGPALWL
jgi:hypothetical protein